jgi:hypothetical protein
MIGAEMSRDRPRVFELVEIRIIEPDRKRLDRPRRRLRHHADDG